MREPLTRDEAKALLVRCLSAGRIVYSVHVEDNVEIDGLTRKDVSLGCRSGGRA